MSSARRWLSELGLFRQSSGPTSCPETLGILAFETAKVLSRLLALHASLTDSELYSLRHSVFRSEGVAYLNSTDENFLIYLACSEKLHELDRAAIAVARLCKRCCTTEHLAFDETYANLKLGSVDLSKLAIPTKKLDRKIMEMGKLVSQTADFHSALVGLSELEVAERKLLFWKSYSSRISLQKPDSKMFEQKIAWQRNHVKRTREASLWNQPFERTVRIMSQIVCSVFVRICIVFGTHVSNLPQPVCNSKTFFVVSPKLQFWPQKAASLGASRSPERLSVKSVISGKFGGILRQREKKSKGTSVYASGPLEISTVKDAISAKFRKRENDEPRPTLPNEKIRYGFDSATKRRGITEEAAATTLGYAALAFRYAHVIMVAEKIMNFPETVDDETRGDLYRKLPWRLRMRVNAKMRQMKKRIGTMRLDRWGVDGWKNEVGRILRWLSPMARDMIQWQAERNLQRQGFDPQPTVLLLQTLYFSDREKTEEAIAEVLVGLSCILRHQGGLNDEVGTSGVDG